MILAYVVRSLLARGRTTLTALLVISATTGAITMVLGLERGLENAITGKRQPGLAVVVQSGATTEFDSEVPAEVLAQLAVSPAIAVSGGHALISAERTNSLPMKQVNGGVGAVRIRGVDPIAYEIHPEVKVRSGEIPSAGTRNVLIGSRLVGRYAGFKVGGTVHLGHHKWTITGVIDSPGGSADSELWCDRAALASEMRNENHSIIFMKLASATGLAEVKDTVDKMRGQKLDVLTADEMHARGVRQASIFINAIFVIVAVLCISAVFSGTSATYSLFIGQMRELGTLMAIGFTRTRVASMVLLQSLILVLVSAVIGLGLASLANGYTFVFHEMMLVYEVSISHDVLMAGAIAAALIGVFGSFIAVVQTYQLDILGVLRD